jgi:Cytochrome c, mono- and diheme variants
MTLRTRSTVLAVLLALLLAACSDATSGLTGAALYERACASCHGRDLGGGIGPALGPGSTADLSLDDAQIAGAIRVGPGSMPPFARLTDAQVASLVRYLREVQAGSR